MPFESTKPDALLLVDVVASVRLMQADEAGYMARWQGIARRVIHDIAPGQGGRLIKSQGDSLMLAFAQPRGALNAALLILQAVAHMEAGEPHDKRIALHGALHLARYQRNDIDIYGSDVNLLARLAGIAGASELVASVEFKDTIVDGLDADVVDLGDCFLKNWDQPVRVYRLSPVGSTSQRAVRHGDTLDARPRIAVLPFEAQFSDPAHRWIGNLLADQLTAALSQSASVHVISALSSAAMGSQPRDARSLRHHLGASCVLGGRVMCSGDQLSMYAQLTDTESGRVLWAEMQHGTVQALLGQDQSMSLRMLAAVPQIEQAVLREQLQRARTQAPHTLEGYTLLLGSIALMHRTSPSDFARAHAMLTHLGEREPHSPLPQAWMAKWHVLRVQQGWAEDPDIESRRASAACARAIDIDPSCALGWVVNGFLHTNLMGDLDEAQACYDEALALNPNESLAWLLRGMRLAFLGQGEPAVASAQKALSLSPLDPLRYFYEALYASSLITARRYDEAIEVARHSLRLNRMHLSTHRTLVLAQSLGGHVDDARTSAAHLLRLDPTFTVERFTRRYPGRHHAPQFAGTLASALQEAGVPAH